MLELADWFWPIISALFALLWLWTLTGRWKGRSKVQPSESQALPQRREAEDLLKAVHALQVREGQVSVEELTRPVHLPETVIREEVDALLTFGWVERGSEGSLRFTDEGRHRAGDLIRAHRLWERYLVDPEGMALAGCSR